MPTNRRKFLMQSGMAAAAAVTVKHSKAVSKLNSWILNRHDSDNTITLLHTNDIRNRLHPENNFSPYAGMGGFHQTSAVIADLKKKRKNVVLLDAGNHFSGYQSEKDEHLQTLALMSQLRYDATLPGHRDVKAGVDHFANGLMKNNIPAVVSNYTISSSELREVMMPYRMVKKGNIRIGIVGVGKKLNNVGAEYNDVVNQVSSVATMLKKQKNCNVVVCLSQLGYKNKNSVDDLTLAEFSEHIDVIIGGHSCTFMRQPTIILNKNNEEVIINHAGRSGIMVGNIEIAFDDNGKKKSVAFTNHFIGRNKKDQVFAG